MAEPSKDSRLAKQSSAATGLGDQKRAPSKARTRLNEADGREKTERASSPASDRPPHKRTTPREIHRELSELAAKQQLGRKGQRRLEEILNEVAGLASKRPEYRRLYERALQIQKRALTPPRRKKRPGDAAGFFQNPGLSHRGREILSGLPSSRRGH